MSVNTANTPDGRGVLIFNGEVIIIFCQGVNMTFGKSENVDLKGKRSGTVYLTSHRIIFMPDISKHWLKSFDMPFSCMRNVQLQQPIFGANYLCGIASPTPGSNLRCEVPWELVFNKGGCIDFGHSLLAAVDRASHSRPCNAPPSYVPPAGDYYAAPPDYYTTSNTNFQAPGSLPERPNPENVFVHEAPPPYPGIGAEHPPLPTQELRVAGQSTGPPPYGFVPEVTEGLRRRN
ncbi:unnamed protein product [Auanema sp. JU1783]|nr:unnamed protein product [Auanema sp. JU1783]